MRKIIINGRFMSQEDEGVRRYARQKLHEINSQAAPGDELILAVARDANGSDAYTNGSDTYTNGSDAYANGSDTYAAGIDKAAEAPVYEHIRQVSVGRLKGAAWEQISLPLYCMKEDGICVSLCGVAPVLTPHVVVLHDSAFASGCDNENLDCYLKKSSLRRRLLFAAMRRRIKVLVLE